MNHEDRSGYVSFWINLILEEPDAEAGGATMDNRERRVCIALMIENFQISWLIHCNPAYMAIGCSTVED